MGERPHDPWQGDRGAPGRILDAGGLTNAAFPVAPAPLQLADQPVTCGDVQVLRNTIAYLVALDGQHGGAELLPLAARTRTFRTASARLEDGNYPAGFEADFTATVAELGEVAVARSIASHEELRIPWAHSIGSSASCTMTVMAIG